MAAPSASGPNVCASIIGVLVEYDTPKIVHVKSIKIGILNRLIQLAIIAYVIGYVIVYSKGYQLDDTAIGVATTKLKGVDFTNASESSPSRIWDVADYVIPPLMNGAFFMMTNMVVTPDQTNSQCAEDPSMHDVICESDSDCPEGVAVVSGNGIRTGRCVAYNSTLDTCEIHAWCPVEYDVLPSTNEPALAKTANFTLLIKNHIEFPLFGVTRRNILDSPDSDYLKGCRYNSRDPVDKYCPIFVIGDIVEQATGQPYNDISVVGGVIKIKIDWSCDLDHSLDQCTPSYSFVREDDPDARIGIGNNFRFSDKWMEAGVMHRSLTKAYGIMFVIVITGTGGKFDVIPLMMNIASGFALLIIASVACDFFMMYLHKQRKYFKKKKYLDIDEDVISKVGYASAEVSNEFDHSSEKIEISF